MCIAYDPSREALLQPGLRPTLFRTGDAEPLSIDAICAECARLVYRFESSAAHREVLLEAFARLDAVDRTTARIEYLRDEAWRTGAVLVRDLADHAPINYERALFPPCEARELRHPIGMHARDGLCGGGL